MAFPSVLRFLAEHKEMLELLERVAKHPCGHKVADPSCAICAAGHFVWKRTPPHERPMEKRMQQHV